MSVSVQFTAIRTKAQIKPDTFVRGQLNEYMANFIVEIMTVMRPYPPKPAWSTYDRTGTLGGSWRVRPLPRYGVGFILENRATQRGREYASYVVGRRQMWYHERTGWPRLHDVFSDLGGRNRLKRGVQAVLNRAFVDFRRGV